MASNDEAPLSTWGSGEQPSNASIRAGSVLKVGGAWSPSVISLLAHFERVGFDGSPRVSDGGLLPDGRMCLTYVPGSSAHPRAWRPGACAQIGTLLRQVHDATASFVPPANGTWAESWVREVGDEDGDVVIGHGDAAPWNIVGPDAWPAALIDWDLAGPISRVTEVAYAVWLNAQLHDDDIAAMHDLPDLEARAQQARELVDAYGMSRAQREMLLDRMIELAIAGARADAVTYRVTPDSTDAHTASGFPLMWSITWRARSAAWMLRNRRTLGKTIFS